MSFLRRSPRGPVLLGVGAGVLLAVVAGTAFAQSFSMDLGDGGGSSVARMIQLIAMFTVLSLAPSILVMVTSFTRITIVLGMLRTAMGVQQAPPNMVMIGLSLFLTFFIMQPTLEKAYNEGVRPLIAEEISEGEALARTIAPFHSFMMRHVRTKDVQLFMDLSKTAPVAKPEDVPLKVLLPAFMISELRRAFEIGFLIFIPFLIIDMVVSSVLMAMGMMMLPPMMVSMPFKLIFFVLVDGWNLIAGALVQSFGE